MKKEMVIRLFSEFEARANQPEDGPEFWLARHLQELLGYADWRNFLKVVAKAKTSCTTFGEPEEDHFVDVTKMVEVGSGGQRKLDDVALTRYACYLIAQNGDPSKPEIAFAQTYFALQTRAQELVVQRLAEAERVSAREKLTDSENRLSGAIYERLKDGQSFARIRSRGDRALFGGKTTQDMKDRLGVPKSRPLADFLPTITIKAKDFANEVTQEAVRREDLRSENEIASEHEKSNKDVRNVLQTRGILPEELPPAEDLKKVERRLKTESKKLAKDAKTKNLPKADDV